MRAWPAFETRVAGRRRKDRRRRRRSAALPSTRRRHSAFRRESKARRRWDTRGENRERCRTLPDAMLVREEREVRIRIRGWPMTRRERAELTDPYAARATPRARSGREE